MLLSVGYLIDIMKNINFYQFILLGVSLLLTNIVNGFNGLLFVLLLIGMFYSVSQPGGSKVILKWFRKSRISDGNKASGYTDWWRVSGSVNPVSYSTIYI